MLCCIPGCRSTTMNQLHGVRFYHFPSNNTHMPWLCDKRQKWIDAIIKHTSHPNDWLPSKYTRICSAHFIGNKKTENPLDPSYVPTIFPGAKSKSHKLEQKLTRSEMHQRRVQQYKLLALNTDKDALEFSSKEENVQPERLVKLRDHHQVQQVSEVNTVNYSLKWSEGNIKTERLTDQSVGCRNDLSKGLGHHQIRQVSEIQTVNDSMQWTEENIKTERPDDQSLGCQSDDLSTGLDHHQIKQESEIKTVNDSMQWTEENIKTERLADQSVGCYSVSHVNTVTDSFQWTEGNIKTERLPDQSDDLSMGHQACDTHSFPTMININGICTAESQNNIASKVAHKSCEVNIPTNAQVKKEFSDPLDQYSQELLGPGFHGISSIKTEEDLISLTGVTYAVFHMLLNMLPDSETSSINKKTQLLITLMKLKTGLCFSVLSIIFQIHKRTISRLFEETLFLLHSALKKFIIWPSKSTVQANMPEPFKLHYANTCVIIDCAEVETEYPPTVEQRDHMYSEYKHGYTIKFLVGCTPCGFISFVSKCYGGCSSDCFITDDCGLFNLLELGDTALADKGSVIKIGVENKNSVIVRTPFSSEEVDETNQIASLRIHIERIMQRIKQFHIFDKMPISLLKYRDEIVFTVCALVNVENPIIKQEI